MSNMSSNNGNGVVIGVALSALFAVGAYAYTHIMSSFNETDRKRNEDDRKHNEAQWKQNEDDRKHNEEVLKQGLAAKKRNDQAQEEKMRIQSEVNALRNQIASATNAMPMKFNVGFLGISQAGKSTLMNLLYQALGGTKQGPPVGNENIKQRTTMHVVRYAVLSGGFNLFDAPGFTTSTVLDSFIVAMNKGVKNQSAIFDPDHNMLPLEKLEVDPENAIHQWVIVIDAKSLCEDYTHQGVVYKKIAKAFPDDLAKFLTGAKRVLANYDCVSVVFTHADQIDPASVSHDELKNAVASRTSFNTQRMCVINATNTTESGFLPPLQLAKHIVQRNVVY